MDGFVFPPGRKILGEGLYTQSGADDVSSNLLYYDAVFNISCIQGDTIFFYFCTTFMYDGFSCPECKNSTRYFIRLLSSGMERNRMKGGREGERDRQRDRETERHKGTETQKRREDTIRIVF